MQRLRANNWRLNMMGRTELCAWLRANSSGDYRPAAEAADEIEHLAAAKEQHFAQAMRNGAKAREYRDEADALRKDAERYRWLRKSGAWESEIGMDVLSERPERFDAAVDAAMAADAPGAA